MTINSLFLYTLTQYTITVLLLLSTLIRSYWPKNETENYSSRHLLLKISAFLSLFLSQESHQGLDHMDMFHLDPANRNNIRDALKKHCVVTQLDHQH